MIEMYEKNIVEVKNEYTTFLTNIMAPLMYEGIKGMYNNAVEFDTKIKKMKKDHPDADIKDPGVLKIFQSLLVGIKNLNNHKIEYETNRIRESSKCAEYFDQLVSAVVKSYIVLLTFNINEKRNPMVDSRYHENIDINVFVHKAYIETARVFYNYPELFWHEYKPIDIKRNQREANNLIKQSIIEAIRKMLPMKLILEEYLKTSYITDEDDQINEDIPKSRYHNIKAMLERDSAISHLLKETDSDEEKGNTNDNDNKYGSDGNSNGENNSHEHNDNNSHSHSDHSNNDNHNRNTDSEEIVKMEDIIGRPLEGNEGNPIFIKKEEIVVDNQINNGMDISEAVGVVEQKVVDTGMRAGIVAVGGLRNNDHNGENNNLDDLVNKLQSQKIVKKQKEKKNSILGDNISLYLEKLNSK